MKKIFIFFGTLFFLSLTVSSFAQERTLNKNQEKKKTENLEKSDAAVKKDEEPPVLNIIYEMAPVMAVISPHYTAKKLKLKVTLVELQSDVTQNGELAHLGMTQHIIYKSKGIVIKPESVDLSKVGINNPKCGRYQFTKLGVEATRPKPFEGSTALFCGDRKNQIHVTQSKQPLNRTPNINHSAVFSLTPEQVSDTNAEFILDTYVVEYSTTLRGAVDTSIVLNQDPRETKVAIHDVLAILQGKKKLNEDTRYFKDGGVPSHLLFDHFDGVSLPLRNVNKNGKMILEGPIRVRNKGTKLIEKAFVWMRFELID